MSIDLTRRNFLGLMGAGAVSMGLAGCGTTQVDSSNTASEETATTVQATAEKVRGMSEEEEEEAWKNEPAYGKTLNLGYTGGLCLGALGIGLSNGFYQDEGLDVTIVNMSNTTDAIGSGKVDVAGDHIATLLVPATNGVKLTMAHSAHTGCKSLYVLGSSDIQKTSDLVGKTVGLPEGIGTSDHNIAMRFFNRDDVDINSVNWKAVTSDAVVQALQNDEVQAATLSDQFAYKFVQDGTLRAIRSITTDDDFKNEPCCIVTFNTDFFQSNPVTAKKFVRAFTKASEWVQNNKEEFVDVMFENNWSSGDKDVALDLANRYNFTVSDSTTKAALTDIITDYKKFNVIESKDDVDTILNNVFAPVLA
ncbi:MAG: ABC transporter substrate-binding protein [Atopobiaceae bacterium]|jgi:NitT/TauT family transport system substrate-binding protein